MMKKWKTIWVPLIIMLLQILYNSALSDHHHHHRNHDSNTMRFELIHRHSPYVMEKLSIPSKTRFERIQELLHSDIIRHQMIVRKREMQNQAHHVESIPRRKDWDVPVEMPMHSAADFGTGEYFVGIKVGTPAQKFLLVADTGSDLTWVNCNDNRRNMKTRMFEVNKDGGRSRRRRRVFQAARSLSFKSVPCLSEMCKIELMNLFSLASCPSPLAPCAYDYRYADGSSAVGIFANETVTLKLRNGRKTKLDNVLIGCSESSKGQSFEVADGVLGLGYSNFSFALKAGNRFRGKFSYCLVDHLSPQNVSNYLTFGSRHHKTRKTTKTSSMQFTRLTLGVISSFYAVNIMGISADGVMLKVPSEVWNTNGVGGTILDSGTSLTILTTPAYQPVMSALKESLLKFPNLELNIGPLEYCFNSTTGFNESLVPRLVFHFEDGARFEPPVKSYIIDTADGVKCIGLVPASWPGTSVIGNIVQQNHLWDFDLVNRRLGFAPSACT